MKHLDVLVTTALTLALSCLLAGCHDTAFDSTLKPHQAVQVDGRTWSLALQPCLPSLPVWAMAYGRHLARLPVVEWKLW